MNNTTRVVIVGAGFGGLAAARSLAKRGAAVHLIDRHNHHLFQPLLYQVATAGLAAGEVSMPIRSVLRGYERVDVVLGEVLSVDRATREVTLRDAAGTRTIAYDWLVLACGAETTYFGHDDWAEVASSMKTLDDAATARRKLLLAFETAEAIADSNGTAAWLTFVVVGGGPTGVELAGAIAELSHRAMSKDFRHIDPKRARIVLVEAGNRLLAQFPEDLGVFARRDLERLGVEVRLGAKVERISASEVVIGGEAIATHTVIWAAGVTPVPVGRWLGAETDRGGRVVVTPFLHLEDDDRVFVLGDGAHVMQDGAPLPGLAPVATQEGRYVAKRIHALIQGIEPPSRFRYVDKGSLATIGRASAVGVIAGYAVHGMIAWLLWAVVHVMYLIGFRNRLFVVLDWTWAYFTYQRGARVLVGDVGALTASEPAPPARPASVQKVPSREQPTAIRSDARPHPQ